MQHLASLLAGNHHNQLEDDDLRAGYAIIATALKQQVQPIEGEANGYATAFMCPLFLMPQFATFSHDDLLQHARRQMQQHLRAFFVGLYGVGNGHYIPYVIYQHSALQITLITADPKQEFNFKKMAQTKTDFARIITGEFTHIDMQIRQQSFFNGIDCGFFSLHALRDMVLDIVLAQKNIFTIDEQGHLVFNRDSLSIKHNQLNASRVVRAEWEPLLDSLKEFETVLADGSVLKEDYAYSTKKQQQRTHDAWRAKLTSYRQRFLKHKGINEAVKIILQDEGKTPIVGEHATLDALLEHIIPPSHGLHAFMQAKQANPEKYVFFKGYIQQLINELARTVIFNSVDRAINPQIQQSANSHWQRQTLQQWLHEADSSLANQYDLTCEQLLKQNDVYDTYCREKIVALNQQAQQLSQARSNNNKREPSLNPFLKKPQKGEYPDPNDRSYQTQQIF